MLLAVSVNATAGFEDVTMDEQLALVHFDSDVSALDTMAITALSKLNVTENSEVIIIGKTDSRGTDEYNVALGLRRAKSVASFLKIDDASVSSVGRAEAKELKFSNMRLDRVALVKVITPHVELNPLFGDAMMKLQGPVSHLQYDTVPIGQGAKRVQQPRM